MNTFLRKAALVAGIAAGLPVCVERHVQHNYPAHSSSVPEAIQSIEQRLREYGCEQLSAGPGSLYCQKEGNTVLDVHGIQEVCVLDTTNGIWTRRDVFFLREPGCNFDNSRYNNLLYNTSQAMTCRHEPLFPNEPPLELCSTIAAQMKYLISPQASP